MLSHTRHGIFEQFRKLAALPMMNTENSAISIPMGSEIVYKDCVGSLYSGLWSRDSFPSRIPPMVNTSDKEAERRSTKRDSFGAYYHRSRTKAGLTIDSKLL